MELRRSLCNFKWSWMFATYKIHFLNAFCFLRVSRCFYNILGTNGPRFLILATSLFALFYPLRVASIIVLSRLQDLQFLFGNAQCGVTEVTQDK